MNAMPEIEDANVSPQEFRIVREVVERPATFDYAAFWREQARLHRASAAEWKKVAAQMTQQHWPEMAEFAAIMASNCLTDADTDEQTAMRFEPQRNER